MQKYQAKDSWGDNYVDVVALANDLAPLVGGTAGEMEPGKYGQGRIELDGYALTISPNSKAKGAEGITVRAWLRGCGELHHSERPNLPEANMTICQPLEKIAANIRRRVVEPSAEPLALYQEKLGAHRSRRAQLEQVAAELSKAFPHVDIKVPEDKQATSARVYGRGSAYFQGDLSFDGALSIQRIGSLKGDDAKALLHLLGRLTRDA